MSIKQINTCNCFVAQSWREVHRFNLPISWGPFCWHVSTRTVCMVINDILCVMVWATGILQISCSDFCKQIFRSCWFVWSLNSSLRCQGCFSWRSPLGMDSLASLFWCLILDPLNETYVPENRLPGAWMLYSWPLHCLGLEIWHPCRVCRCDLGESSPGFIPKRWGFRNRAGLTAWRGTPTEKRQKAWDAMNCS